MFVSRKKYLQAIAERDAASLLALEFKRINQGLTQLCKDYREELAAITKDGLGTFNFADINEQDLRVMIGMCHPDRHPGREDVATRITTKLVEVRKKARQG